MAGIAQLDGALNDSDTEFPLSGTLTTPQSFVMLVDDELIKVTSYENGEVTSVDTSLRGFGNSVAAAHDDGTQCYQVVGVVGSGDGFVVNYLDGSDVFTRSIGGSGDDGASVVLAEFAGFSNQDPDITGNEGAGFNLEDSDDAENADLFAEVGFITEQEAD